MKTVAIITEYNPFHYGHLYQINAIKKAVGEDTRIIAIMSGNFTQRGELAIADKTIRSRAAVDAGVDLILELPFPYSISSAEFFARAGVAIADAIGVVDYLAFGSESGDIEELSSAAAVLGSEEYMKRLAYLQASPEHTELGYPKLCEIAYLSICQNGSANIFSPNNILALEYIKALNHLESKIKPITVKRIGSDYNNDALTDGKIQSAGAIRPLMYLNDPTALDYIPAGAREAYSEALASNIAPTEACRLDTALISHLRLNSPECIKDIHDAAGGLYNRLHDASFEADSISALMQLAETKRYTNARIRRAIWNSYFGVTSSDVRALPAYTQVLAMNDTGRALLKEIKTKSDFPVITKPSAYQRYGNEVIRQKRLSDRADSVFALSQRRAISGRFPLTFTPYVKKG